MKSGEEQLARFFCHFIANQATSHADTLSEEQEAMDRIVKRLGNHIIKQDAYIIRIKKQMQDIAEKHDIEFVIENDKPSIHLEDYGYEI